MRVQVRELQQQLSDQLQESIGDGARPGREAALQQRVQQLETMLRHARDIHGVSMPLLDSDEGVLMDPPQLPTAGTLTTVAGGAVAVVASEAVCAVAAMGRSGSAPSQTTTHVDE